MSSTTEAPIRGTITVPVTLDRETRSASGELRLSNFLLWQLAYAEFVFLDTYWPDFSREQLEAALAEYHRRSRRFGGTSSRSTARL